MTVADPPSAGHYAAAEIVRGDVSGGTNTSHTIVVGALTALLDAVPADAPHAAYAEAAIDGNVVGKSTEGARRRTFRYLRELYLLRPDSLLFRALRDLWPVDPLARPLLAGLCALARDSVFRATSTVITRSSPGDTVTSADLADAVAERFPASYGVGTLAKIGWNTFSSWEQTGHLADSVRPAKVRVRATCQPADIAYALLLGHVEGARGQALFETPWARVLRECDLHREAIGEHAGLSRPTIARIERGDDVSTTTLAKVAASLGAGGLGRT